jgi:putative transposase
MPKLRNRIGKWSYSRQRKMVAQKRAELGNITLFDDEYNTSRKWIDGYSYILRHSCGSKIDADFNAAYNILKKIYPLAMAIWAYNNSFRNALRCQDDWLKVQMNMAGEKPHASA